MIVNWIGFIVGNHLVHNNKEIKNGDLEEARNVLKSAKTIIANDT